MTAIPRASLVGSRFPIGRVLAVMNYLKRKFQSSESGVTLILVLMLVAAVGLLVVPLMLIGASGLRATNFSEQRFNERYSVDAGVEDALWRIRHETGPSALDLDRPKEYTRTFNGLETVIKIKKARTPLLRPAKILAPARGSTGRWHDWHCHKLASALSILRFHTSRRVDGARPVGTASD